MKRSAKFTQRAVATAISTLLLGPSLALAQANAGLEEVVVTAQKVKENLQKVPLSITALNGDALGDAGVKNLLNLQNLVTGINVIDQGAGASVQIRGIGSNPGGGNIDPSVAFSMDGVYQSRSSGALGSMYDVRRVEVLKGPQGTLYGRNATVGAMNVISNNPTDKLEGSVELELGNYNLRRALAVINVPVNDVVKIRGVLQGVKRDGFLSDGYNDADDVAGRLKIAVDPSKDLSILFTLDGHTKTGNGQGNIYTGTVVNSPATPAPGAPFTQVHTVGRDDSSNPWNLKPNLMTPASLAVGGAFSSTASAAKTGHAETANAGLKVRNQGFTAEINKDFGGATLTVIPAVRSSYALNQGGTGGSFQNTQYSIVDASQQSLEARLASSGTGPLRWIGGLFYMNEDAPTLFAARAQSNASTTFTNMTEVNSKTAALFGQGTYSLATDTRLTLGMRYTKDDKKQTGRIYMVTGATVDPNATNYALALGGAPISANGAYSNTSLTYKAGIDKDLGKDTMVYANVSTGYKAGGLNFDGAGGARQTFSPEKLIALAVGGKHRGMDNRLQLNAEAFLWKYKDQQLAVLDQLDNPGAMRGSAFSNVMFVNNPGTSTVYGFDLDAVFKVTPNDRISGSLAYLHARNGSFTTAQTTSGAFPTGPGTFGVAPFQASANLSGQVMPFSPTWQMNLGYSHIWNLEGGATLTGTLDAHMETQSYVNFNLFEPERQPAYIKGNLALNYASANGKLSVTGYVRNFTNVAVLTRGSVLGSTGGTIAHYAGIMDPRTFGVTASFKF